MLEKSHGCRKFISNYRRMGSSMGMLLTSLKGKQTIMMTFGNQHQHPCRICQQEQTTKMNKIFGKILNVEEVHMKPLK